MMSFKLLAIRPLEGTDPSLLKGLKPNCIYRFYNEYDYLYEYDENTGEGKSFIDLQDLFFQTIGVRREEILYSLKNNIAELNNSEDIRNCLKKIIEDDVFKDEYFKRFIKEKKDAVDDVLVNASTIELFKKDALRFFNNRILTTPKSNCVAIKYNQQIPDDFFGENINVSAIVGENGSGKSSLLEVYYHFLYNYSFYKEILRNDDDPVLYLGKNCHIELYYEYYNEIIKVVFKPVKGETTSVHYIIKNSVFVVDSSNVDLTERDFYKESFTLNKKEANLPTYNIALNYGLYGLNSSIDGYGWLKPLFHKNDGYQTPIVISPLRTYGNIDINTENRLLIQRLVINHFVIGNKKLLSNIFFVKASYSLEVYKYQFYSYKINEINEITIRDMKILLYQRKISNDDLDFFKKEKDSQFVIFWFKRFLKFIFKEENELSALETFLSEFKKYNVGIDSSSLLDYWKYNVIDNDFFVIDRDKNILELGDIQYLNLLYIYNKLYKMTLYYEEYFRFNYLFNSFYSDELKILLKEQEDTLQSKIIEQKEVLNEQFYTDVYHIYEEVEKKLKPHTIVNAKNRFDYIKGLIEALVANGTENLSKRIIDEIFNNIDSIDLRLAAFKQFVRRVMNQDTHIEFKVHQAISYFESNTFESLIDVGKSVFNERSGYYDLHIKEGYFTNVKGESKVFDINKIPIAFFNLDVLVKKNTEQNPYSFRNLSSGEQQMINGLLTITYHLFNIKSVHQSTYEKIKYLIINIIMDEIELYFHPEYQRIFVKELRETLLYFPNFKYNVMMATHSPFILSDIPSQNVLKLKDGKPVAGDSINSFGANIHDLLADEFFLKNGFMGEFAKNKIDRIYKSVLDNSPIDEKKREQLLSEINLIGEKVIRIPLLEEVEKRFQKSISDKQSLIEYYQSKIDELSTK
ncbi:hypothetical protein [Myroides odoratimimus]|uniref:hypothetical protein n=1 Tax=Myroides odoratimimus TaxID=76832 RepID=UPI003100BB12